MPRAARFKKGDFCIYHIVERGNEKRNIFFDDEDKSRFLSTLGRMKHKYNFILYTYCLMSNHVHFIINSNGNDISKIMKSLNVSYVSYFNKKYQRCGHLFQDRFWSEVVESDSYLLEVSRYIHLNPVRAGMAFNPEDYRWSSYREYVGKEDHKLVSILDTTLIWDYFSHDKMEAIPKYREFIVEAINLKNEELVVMDVDDDKKPLNKPVDVIINNIARQSNLQAADITLKGTKYKESRNRAIREIKEQTDLSLKTIGKLFGLSESLVSKILK